MSVAALSKFLHMAPEADADAVAAVAASRLQTLEETLQHFTTAFDMYFENGPQGRRSPKFFDSALDQARTVLRKSE